MSRWGWSSPKTAILADDSYRNRQLACRWVGVGLVIDGLVAATARQP
jgi:hypothetical protein